MAASFIHSSLHTPRDGNGKLIDVSLRDGRNQLDPTEFASVACCLSATVRGETRFSKQFLADRQRATETRSVGTLAHYKTESKREARSSCQTAIHRDELGGDLKSSCAAGILAVNNEKKPGCTLLFSSSTRTRRSPSYNVLPGFTLLELMLALSLTVIVLLAVNMAIDVHLRSLDKRRTQLEESQLARSLLRMIADDLRGTVLHYEQDTTEIEALLTQSAASAAQSLGQAAAAAGVTGSQVSSEATSGNADSGNAAGSPQGGSQGGSQGVSSAAAGDGGGSSRGGSGGTSASAGSGASNSGNSGSLSSNSSGSSGSSGSSTSGAASTEAGQNTADLSTTTIPPVPGLFGNQYQMQIDVSRLPRIENYQQYLTPDAATTVMDVPSDVKTVTYFVQNNAMASASGAATQKLQDLTDPDANATGLVRRELDRSVTMWAMNNGNTALQNTGDVIAPEVAAIEFQYFDGTEWVLEWDTEVQQKLPIAVLVIVAIRPPGTAPAPDVALSELTPEDSAGLHLYRTLVYLPAGGQSTESESSAGSAGSSTLESGSDTSSGAATGGSL